MDAKKILQPLHFIHTLQPTIYHHLSHLLLPSLPFKIMMMTYHKIQMKQKLHVTTHVSPKNHMEMKKDFYVPHPFLLWIRGNLT